MKHAFVSISFFLCVTLFTSSTGALATPVAGDIDHSGNVDAVDVQLVINAALGIDISGAV